MGQTGFSPVSDRTLKSPALNVSLPAQIGSGCRSRTYRLPINSRSLHPGGEPEYSNYNFGAGKFNFLADTSALVSLTIKSKDTFNLSNSVV